MKHLKLLLFAFVLQSCTTTYYQVCTVDSDINMDENALIYSDSNCDIIYNLWGEGGNLDFIFVNKTDSELCLDMEHSFAIYNGMARDYYEDTEFSTSTSVNIASSKALMKSYNANITKYGYTHSPYINTPTSIGGSVTASGLESTTTSIAKSNTVTKKTAKYIYIPAKAAKVIQSFTVAGAFFKRGNKKFDTPKRESELLEFNSENTPLLIRNNIKYTIKDETFVANNSFWINSIQNYVEHAIIKETSRGKIIEISSAPNVFYNKKTILKEPF